MDRKERPKNESRAAEYTLDRGGSRPSPTLIEQH